MTEKCVLNITSQQWAMIFGVPYPSACPPSPVFPVEGIQNENLKFSPFCPLVSLQEYLPSSYRAYQRSEHRCINYKFQRCVT